MQPVQATGGDGAPPADVGGAQGGEASAHESGLARRVGTAMAWGQAGKVLEVALSTAIAIVVVRALRPSGFGTYSLLTNLVGVASVLIPVITTEALGAVLPRFADARQRVYLVGVVAVLRVAIIVAVAALVIPSWNAVRDDFGLGHVPVLVVLAAAVYWIAQDLLNTVGGLFVAALDVRRLTLWRAAGQLATLTALVAVGVVANLSVGTALVLVAGGYALAAATLVLALRRFGRPARPDRQQIRFVLGFTRNVWLIAVVSLALAPHLYSLMIGLITKDAAEVAFYVAAVGVLGRAQVLLLSGWSALIIPAFGALRQRDGVAGLARGWELFTKFWLLVAAPTSALLLVLATPLIEVLFGSEYAASVTLLQVVAGFGLASAFLAAPTSIGILWALDLQRLLVRVRLVTTPLAVGLSIVLIREYEALGAVLAAGIATAATSAAELVLARRAVAFTYPVALAAWAGAACAVLIVPALLLRPDSVVDSLAATALGVVAFAGLALAIRPFAHADLDAIRRVSPRLYRPWLGRFARS